MSLFVGNVSKHVTHRELETLFKKYGKSKIDLRVFLFLSQDRFAFVQFDNDNHAEAAKK
jgi:RNA recognition motif-containing protein